MAGGDAMLMHAVDSYLAVRRALGFKLRDQEWYLRAFARLAQMRGETIIRAKTAVEWATLGATARQRDFRLKIIIRLARYLRAEDDRHEVPPSGVFGHYGRQPRVPFIYSPLDFRRLLDEAAHLPPAGSFRAKAYWTLFALLSATGLRISEALALRIGDVTLDGLLIRETKFKKSRLVPLHPTAVSGLGSYLAHRRKLGVVDDHLFVSERGRPLGYCRVGKTFLQLVRGVGLHPGPGRRGPRIHDLRHTFAVRALEASPIDRDRVGRHLLALSTYLGHVSVANTYWYLRSTPQLMRDIAQTAEDFVEGGAQ